MNEIAVLVLLFAASFILGSIPWGVINSRVFYHTDVRDHGSGNIGTTNAIRTMGKVGGGAVFVLDFGKGLFSGFLAWLFFTLLVDPAGSTHSFTYQTLAACAFFGCITGHIFSPWLGFKGGKGVAVAVGCMFATFGWQFALIELALFAVVVITTRYVSALSWHSSGFRAISLRRFSALPRRSLSFGRIAETSRVCARALSPVSVRRVVSK